MDQLGYKNPIVDGLDRASATEAPSATMVLEEVKGELKKLNKHARQLIHLKKQDNLMAALFYFCVIALGFGYLLIISR